MQSVQTENADIAFDVDGTGPLLIMIPGRGGTGGRYARVSAALKEEYRVVRIDRRCCGRSTGDRGRPLDVTQQARDAVAVIQALGESQAFIFGNSAGASIALRIAEYFPETVLGMVAHEPMTFTLLKDAEHWIDFNRQVDHIYRTEGVAPAIKLLGTSMVGMQPPPAAAAQPGPPPDDMKFFLESEFMSLGYYRPDLDRIKRNRLPIVTTKGRLSADAYYARTADVIAERVGCPVRTMSGNHIAHALDPVTFAAELRDVLAEVKTSA